MGEQTNLQYPAADDDNLKTKHKWFSSIGCVEHTEELVSVFISGTLIACFHPADRFARNQILLALVENPRIRKYKLAEAFGLTEEAFRLIRRRYYETGEIPSRPPGGKPSKLDEKTRDRIIASFSRGERPVEVHRRIGKAAGASYQTIWQMRKNWKREKEAAARSAIAQAEQLELPIDEQASIAVEAQNKRVVGQCGIEGDFAGGDHDNEAVNIRSGKMVNHAGGLLLVAAVHALGLYKAALTDWDTSKRWVERMRVAMDAIVLALAIGQRCVEGVRRLETKTAHILLRTERPPSESWVRRIIKKYLEEEGSAKAHLSMLFWYLENARTQEEQVAVFYVDNHMRPYTGKETVRKGWRMQDKRVKPGATDYWVHDEDGRPLFRVDVPSHDSLTQWLMPISGMLREGLGEEQRILVAFDRAGSFPEIMAELRNHDFEFVAYERKPYRKLPASAFTEKIKFEDGEEIGVHEKRLGNLGKGRGRVRRIALRMADESQVNLLAVSKEPAEHLIEIMLGRWIQENGFKHGVQRWGFNQLDGRKVNQYDPATIIPNPGRRRLDHSLRVLRNREGVIRNKLSRLEQGSNQVEPLKKELALNLDKQDQVQQLRPDYPKYAELQETELAGRLVYHDTHKKTFIDTIRIACANVEADFATEIAPHLIKGSEAKKALANLFSSPGDIRVNRKSITISVAPIGRKDERDAFDELFKVVNDWNLKLPGDPKRRRIRFRSQ